LEALQVGRSRSGALFRLGIDCPGSTVIHYIRLLGRGLSLSLAKLRHVIFM